MEETEGTNAAHLQGVEGCQRRPGHAARERTGEEDSQRAGHVQEVSERSERALMKMRIRASERSELVTTSVQTRIRATTNPFAPSSLGAVRILLGHHKALFQQTKLLADDHRRVHHCRTHFGSLCDNGQNLAGVNLPFKVAPGHFCVCAHGAADVLRGKDYRQAQELLRGYERLPSLRVGEHDRDVAWIRNWWGPGGNISVRDHWFRHKFYGSVADGGVRGEDGVRLYRNVQH